MRPSTSLGSLALSNICFAMIPESSPFSAPDFSNKEENSFTFSGDNGGTRIGGSGPDCIGLAGGPAFWGALRGAAGGIPSNRGKGPAGEKMSALTGKVEQDITHFGKPDLV